MTIWLDDRPQPPIGILVLSRARDELDGLAADLGNCRADAALPGTINVGRAASYVRAAVQEIDVAIAKGLECVGVGR